MNPARVAISCGDPLGIGPEVVVRALADPWAGAGADEPPIPFAPVVFGRGRDVERAAALVGVEAPHERVECGGDDGAGAAEAALEAAVAACLAGDCHALVTAPIHKRRLMDAGWPFVGHTEFLAERCGRAGQVAMAFAGGRLRVVLLTTHLPLVEVPAALSADEVVRVAGLFDDWLRCTLGLTRPRLVLCGLNPHAGEQGKLGHEDRAVLAPGVERARAAGIELEGPRPADTTFAFAARGEIDGVIACYHDQGLGPVKAVDFGRSVNITLGLPFTRTSPDHGTADDIAWTGAADPASMRAALRMAVRCARQE